MSMYKQDPNDNTKQIPISPDTGSTDIYNRVTLPSAFTIQERPHSVIVNKTGIYKFLYSTTASNGAVSTTEGYITGSEVFNGGPVELPIQPVAWGNVANAGTVGEITFVYKGVK